MERIIAMREADAAIYDAYKQLLLAQVNYLVSGLSETNRKELVELSRSILEFYRKNVGEITIE